MDANCAPYGYDSWTHTEVVPKPPPTRWRWTIGPVTHKTSEPVPTGQTGGEPSEGNITMQLTADQQVELSISGEDKYGNPVDVTGDVTWLSSDESIVVVEATDASDNTKATAKAVGPAGTASVTVTDDADRDGTGDFMGSLAIDVVAGNIAEIAVSAGEPTDKTDVTPLDQGTVGPG